VTRNRWAVAGGAGFLLLLASFGAAPRPVRAAPSDGGTLLVRLLEDPRLDYATTFDPDSWAIAYATCANLMTYPDQNGRLGARPTPEGAVAYPAVARDGRRYTFRIRPDLRFENGAAVTAANYAAALNRDLDPATRSPGSDYLRDIVGADAVASGKAAQASGVTARGRTLVIRLEAPSPDLVSRLAMPFFCPIPLDLPHDPDAVDALPASGPYFVAEHDPNQAITLERNPFYRGSRPHHASRILFSIGGNPKENFEAVEQGRVDVTDSAPPDPVLPRLLRQYRLNGARLFSVPALATRLLALNSARPLFRDNARLRRAVNEALDRRALVETLGEVHGPSTDHLLPTVAPGFTPARIYPLRRADLPAARRLARGHRRSARAVLFTRSDPDAVLRAEIVKHDLDRIGITVEIKVFAADVLLEKITRRGAHFDIADVTWFSDFGDPTDFLKALVDGRGIRARNNSDMAYFDDPAYDRQIEATSRLEDAARYRALGRLDVRIMRNAAPYVPYASPTGVLFVSKRVGCVVRHPYFLRDYGAFCLKG